MTEFKNQEDFNFIFKDLNYKLKIEKKHEDDPEDKYVLKNINGYCKSSELTAIMGPSGSGKTSLLNFLTDRIEFTQKSEHSGVIYLNSDPLLNKLARISSYVMQDDLLFGILSPRETLEFAAKLRYTMTQEEIDKKIDTLLSDLKLTKCADIIIGNDDKKGISGGERKRISIGIEILSNPHIFFLDEPTSGLDSRTSFIIIEFLKDLAKKYKKAVIFTIHQPSSNIVMMFDRLILLNKGELVYQGVNKDVINYFKTIGQTLEIRSNPADSLIHKIETLNNIKSNELIDKYKELLEKDIIKEMDVMINEGKSGDLSMKNLENSGFSSALKILSYRSYLNIIRNPLILRLRIIMVLIFSFVTCSIFSFLKYGAVGAGNRTGFFFFFTFNNFYQNIYSTISTFPMERSIFLRENAANLYDVVPYFLGKSLVETPVGLFSTFLYAAIVYYIVGLKSDAQSYFTFICIYIVMAFLAQGMGLLLGCAFTNYNKALVFTQFCMLPIFLFSGYLINQANMPIWLSWLRFLSPFRYTMEAVVRNEFDGTTTDFGGAHPTTQLNYDIGLWNCVIIMACLGVFCRIMACYLLKSLVKKTG